MSKPKALDCETWTTTAEAISTIEGILEKLKQGSATLTCGDQSAAIQVRDSTKLSVEVKTNEKTTSLKLKLKWSTAPEKSEGASTLTIS